METLLTEIMISQGNCGKFALKGGDAATVIRISRRPGRSSIRSIQLQIKGHVLAFLGSILIRRGITNDLRPSHLDLQATAKQIMLEHGFEPDFPPQVPQQLADLKAHPPQVAPGGAIRDLRNLLWSSIDNDTSRDPDQIEAPDRLPSGAIKVLVGIADVDAFVRQRSAIDEHAAKETTT